MKFRFSAQKEIDVSFWIGLLHHVLSLDKIPGKKKKHNNNSEHQNYCEDFVDILDTSQ